jgi:hypothetical protein
MFPDPFVGANTKFAAEQVVFVCAIILGAGFTMIETVKGVPVQLPLVGVTVYATVIAVFVVFVKFPEIVLELEPDVVPVIPETVGADHE